MTQRDRRARIKHLKAIVAALRDDVKFSRDYAPERLPAVRNRLALAQSRLRSARQ